MTVFRITPGRLAAATWDYTKGAWLDAPLLDRLFETDTHSEESEEEE